MAAAYDSYDYRPFWNERKYEHESEVYALRSFLSKIPVIKRAIEIGGGYGRLAPFYLFRARKITLTDPSAKLLSFARKELREYKNVEYLQISLENLKTKIKRGSYDLVLMIRVLHHIPNLDEAVNTVSYLLSDGGYFIFEFANKIHAKAVLTQFLKGNFAFLADKSTVDIRSEKSIAAHTLPFLNLHPEAVRKALLKAGFEIVEKRSVSNIRNIYIKKHIPISLLLWVEKILQVPLSYLNFGPSIFVLARKRS